MSFNPPSPLEIENPKIVVLKISSKIRNDLLKFGRYLKGFLLLLPIFFEKLIKGKKNSYNRFSQRMKMYFDKFFLYTTFVKDKKMFVFFCFFLIGQFFFTFKGVETYPFFNYGMFSEKAENSFFVTFEIIVDGKLINQKLSEESLDFLKRNILMFEDVNSNGNYSRQLKSTIENRIPIAFQKYFFERLSNEKITKERMGQWIFSFIEHQTNCSFKEVIINKVTIYGYGEKSLKKKVFHLK